MVSRVNYRYAAIVYHGNIIHKHEVTPETLDENETELVIQPIIKKNCIELRLAWKMTILYFSNEPGWYLFMEALSGEIIKTRQLFCID